MTKRLVSALCLLVGLTCQPEPAPANDTSAVLGVGGLVLARSDAIAMVSEDLTISREKVSVRYTFRNETDRDIRTIVAFPVPELSAASFDLDINIPFHDRGANFVGFETRVNGTSVKTSVEQRALAAGIDHTKLLKAHGIPLAHFTDAAMEKLKTLPKDVVANLQKLGLVRNGDDVAPAWTLKATFYWEQTFPAKADVEIAHSYTPVVGGTAFTLIGTKEADEVLPDYRRKYCVDAAFEAAVEKARASKAALVENWLEYVLKTGANWAGPIGRFRLVVDKGAARNLVSFCGDKVRKISPTRFEMVKTDFYPSDDLRILIIARVPTDN